MKIALIGFGAIGKHKRRWSKERGRRLSSMLTSLRIGCTSESMRGFILAFLLLYSIGCGTNGESESIAVDANLPHPTASPEIEQGPPGIPVIAVSPLNTRQRRELNATLPPKVREILEKADTLEVLGLSSDDKAGIGWYPDVRARLPLGTERSELINAFFFDASAGPNPSACFIPRHGLKATYKGKTVEVLICYQCHLFVVEGDLGEFDGGVYKEGAAAHHLFERILQARSEPIG
jgi:hypothetical protein